ncbi:MAG: hypothetical protein DRO11_00880 [Methanobacteriota archaeon]|nr:MAG: hypothetical protein DRO11_00880 [Euryarchaeota archaeon]
MHHTTIKCPTCGQTIELEVEVNLNPHPTTITTKTNPYESENKKDSYQEMFHDENNSLLAALDREDPQPVLSNQARKSLLSTIKNLDRIYPEGVPLSIVREHAKSKGFSDQTTEELLAQLRKRGDIIPITKDTVKPFRSILRRKTPVNRVNKASNRLSIGVKQL